VTKTAGEEPPVEQLMRIVRHDDARAILLVVDGVRAKPYRKRRRRLEKLLTTRGLPPGLVLTPTTTDPAVAAGWLRGYTSSGIEGVVAKRADQPYRPGVRGWQKLRARLTGEAVIAGVIGPVHAPRVLLLGRPDADGRLQVVGRTTDLSPTTQVTVAAVLQPHHGLGHPWPATLPRSRWGRGGPAEPLVYTRVHPDTVAELVVDPATDGPRWRDPARFVRLRPDLRPGDLHPTGLRHAHGEPGEAHHGHAARRCRSGRSGEASTSTAGAAGA
jgi:ATP-dependent DNA ligase